MFRKPSGPQGCNGKTAALSDTVKSSVFRCKPVMKIVRGTNTHGHSAPFPDELPRVLIRMMTPNSVVLDPFGGSLTTGRVAARHGVKSVCIERSSDYCDLGLRLRTEENDLFHGLRTQPTLFDWGAVPSTPAS
jgi:hypothetical protein